MSCPACGALVMDALGQCVSCRINPPVTFFNGAAERPKPTLKGMLAAMEQLRELPPTCTLLEFHPETFEKICAELQVEPQTGHVQRFADMGAVRIMAHGRLPKRLGRATYSDGSTQMIDLEPEEQAHGDA